MGSGSTWGGGPQAGEAGPQWTGTQGWPIGIEGCLQRDLREETKDVGSGKEKSRCEGPEARQEERGSSVAGCRSRGPEGLTIPGFEAHRPKSTPWV